MCWAIDELGTYLVHGQQNLSSTRVLLNVWVLVASKNERLNGTNVLISLSLHHDH